MKSIFYLLFIILFDIQCNIGSAQNNSYADVLLKHPATDLNNYNQKGVWEDRIYNIDELRIDYVKQINLIDGFSEIPQPTKSMNQMKSLILQIAKNLNPQVKPLFEKYIYGIYFCEKLGGTGLTGYIYNNEENKPIGGIIIIDSNVIQQKANDWITFKENSVFDKSNTELKIQIEDDKNNTLENALRYILLHEIGHILSNVYRITPDARNKTLDYSNHSFLNKIWKTETDSYYDSSEFPFRKNISFYAAPDKKINLDTDWKKIYPVLLKYRFPTMYSATNASDYFAEMFVSYVHCILDKKPWKLSIYQSNKEIYSIENGIHFLHEEREFIRKSIFLKEL